MNILLKCIFLLINELHFIFSGHITNILQELPYHLEEKERKCFNNLLNVSYNRKENKRSADKRLILLQIISHLDGKISNKAMLLLKSLAEIQEVLYTSDKYRNPLKVLRLSNICHLHFIQCSDFFNNIFFSITLRKLFRKYFHNIIIHSPIYRNFSGSSLNVENEERTFKTIKSISSNTSSHHDGHILGNLIIPIQAEEKNINENMHKNDTNNNNEIDKYGKVVAASRQNTIYTYDYIQNNSEVWQTLLETRLSDFLLSGAGVWWKENEFGIEFFDCHELPVEPNFPKLHHSRSSSYNQIFVNVGIK